MSSDSIMPAYSMWPQYNRRLIDVVGELSEDQLAIPSVGHAPRPKPEQWPIWATVGHTACQRVFWLCDFLGEPGAEATRFSNAAYDCPGDDDLENALNAGELVEVLDSTFCIVERCLDRWTIDMLDVEISRDDFGPDWMHTRGSVLRRVFSHDVYHCGELSQNAGCGGPDPDRPLGLRDYRHYDQVG